MKPTEYFRPFSNGCTVDVVARHSSYGSVFVVKDPDGSVISEHTCNTAGQRGAEDRARNWVAPPTLYTGDVSDWPAGMYTSDGGRIILIPRYGGKPACHNGTDTFSVRTTTHQYTKESS